MCVYVCCARSEEYSELKCICVCMAKQIIKEPSQAKTSNLSIYGLVHSIYLNLNTSIHLHPKSIELIDNSL